MSKTNLQKMEKPTHKALSYVVVHIHCSVMHEILVSILKKMAHTVTHTHTHTQALQPLQAP